MCFEDNNVGCSVEWSYLEMGSRQFRKVSYRNTLLQIGNEEYFKNKQEILKMESASPQTSVPVQPE